MISHKYRINLQSKPKENDADLEGAATWPEQYDGKRGMMQSGQGINRENGLACTIRSSSMPIFLHAASDPVDKSGQAELAPISKPMPNR
jgi:hypothetical protein